MSGSNYTDEIKQSMLPNTKRTDDIQRTPAKPDKGTRQPPHNATAHNSDAVAKPPAQQFTDKGPGPQGAPAPTMQGQQPNVPGLGNVVPQHGSGLETAHAHVVHALMMRDRGM